MSWKFLIFKKFVFQANGRNIFKTNDHLLLLDGNNFHVTLEVLHKARNVVLDLIILPSNMNHALQPLDVTCFKPFKIAFRAFTYHIYIIYIGRNTH